MSEIVIKINPIGKPRMTQRDKWSKRPAVLKYWAYKDFLILEAKRQGYELNNVLQAEYFIEMPSSWSKKKKSEMHLKPHQNKPDIDNIDKGIMDALLKNDSAVYKSHTSKYWAYEGEIILHKEI
jgi:Holliday junction resolvase RusA-like endonuclease